MYTLGIPIFNPKSTKFFIDVVAHTIVERSKMANPPHDILDIILRARDNKLENEFNDCETEFGEISQERPSCL